MAHGHSTTPSDVLFCQRNNRLWVSTLIVSAVLVLGLAVFLAVSDGKFTVWKHGVAHPSVPVDSGAAAAGSAGHQVAMTPPLGRAPAAITPNAAAPAAQLTVDVGSQQGLGDAVHLQSSFSQVAREIRPTVVNINAVRPSRRTGVAVAANRPRFVDPFDGVPDRVIGGVALESVGSGVIVDARGYIATNDHLIAGATSIMITRFQDSTPLPADLVTTDPARDLALLKIRGPGPFPAARLANSDDVSVGDWVIAVGNPFGLGHSVTAGIVSSRRSSIVIAGVRYRNLIQTDAPINQGSSGGPLVDLRGNVVGINTAIYAPTGVFNGTGFAIPSNQVGAFVSMAMPAADVAAAAIADVPPTASARVPNVGAGLGIQGTDLSPALSAKLRLSAARGVFVNGVDPGSPAEAAGIRRGDVITGLAGRPVVGTDSLVATLATLPSGLTTAVVIARGGEQLTKQVRLGLASANPQIGR